MYTSVEREIPDRNLPKIHKKFVPNSLNSEIQIRENFLRKSSICEIEPPRKFRATWYTASSLCYALQGMLYCDIVRQVAAQIA